MSDKTNTQLVELYNEHIVLPPNVPERLPTLEPILVQCPTTKAQRRAVQQTTRVLGIIIIILLLILIGVTVIITIFIR